MVKVVLMGVSGSGKDVERMSASVTLMLRGHGEGQYIILISVRRVVSAKCEHYRNTAGRFAITPAFTMSPMSPLHWEH